VIYVSIFEATPYTQKEILNVLQSHLATFMLRRTPLILLNGLSCPEH
jgi:hypothetical protein